MRPSMKVGDLEKGMLVIPGGSWRLMNETRMGSCFIKIVPDIIAIAMFDTLGIDGTKPMIYMGKGRLKKADRYWKAKRFYEFWHPDMGIFKVSGHDLKKFSPLLSEEHVQDFPTYSII